MKTNRHYFAYRSFLPEFDAMKRFAAAGVRTICFFPGNTTNSLGQPYAQYPSIWNWFDRYEFSSLDQQIADLKKAVPEAEFICMIDLNSPEWLSRQLSLAHESGDSFTHLTEALANPRWKEATLHYLRAFLEYAEAHYADSIQAYVLACGHTDEWFDHNGELCGLHKQRACNDWRAAHGLAPAEPPSALKMNTPDYDGLLFDPAVSSGVIEYRRFCSELVGNTICEFAAEARKLIRPEAEIGVFYGYIVTRLGAAESGHLAYEQVLKSPDIDFMISPGSYGDRAMGGGGGWLGCSGSEKLAGKIHMHECDQRTHTHNRDLTPYVSLHVPHWENTEEDVAGIKREFTLALLKRSSLWWFDMWGGFYQEPVLFENFRLMKEIYDSRIRLTSRNVEEVAMIVDPDALAYFDQRSPRQRDFQPDIRKKLNRLGAPFETWCLRDVPSIPNLHEIKFFIFATPWEITPEKAELLNRYVLNHDRTVLWFYAPGISDGKSFDESRIRRWTGADPHVSGLSVQRMNGWTSAFLRNPAELTPATLKSLAKSAGVHLYSDAEIPVYADDRFLALHSKEGGTMTIRLPRRTGRITELFSRKLAAENVSEFQWNFRAPDTVLFEMED